MLLGVAEKFRHVFTSYFKHLHCVQKINLMLGVAEKLAVAMGTVREFAELASTRAALPQLLTQLRFGEGKLALAHSVEMVKPRVPLEEWNAFVLARGRAMRAIAKEKRRLAKEQAEEAKKAQAERRQQQRPSEQDRAHEIYYADIADGGGEAAFTPNERGKMWTAARLAAMNEDNQASTRKRKRRAYFCPEY